MPRNEENGLTKPIRDNGRPAPDRWIFIAWLALLAWLPLPLGSNRPVFWSGMEVAVFLLAMAWLAGLMRGSYRPGPALAAAWPVLLLFALWLIWVALQTVPLPRDWVAVFSPQAAALHLPLPAESDRITLSLDPHATRAAWLKSVAYFCFFVLGLALIDSRPRLRQFAYVMLMCGVLQAAIGVVVAFSGGEVQARGTFPNRNHYAGYLEMCLALGIGLLMSQLSGERLPGRWKARLRELVRLILSPKAIVRLCLVAMVIGLVMSRSRMGNTAFFSSLLVAGTVALALSRHATRSMVVLIASLIVIDVLIIGSWFGVEKVKQRIEQTTLAKENRDEVARHTLRYAKNFPLTGSGLESFATVFPGYRGTDVTLGFFMEAENDYLQFAAETGLFGFALAGGMVLLSLGAAIRAHYVRRDPLLRGMSFASIMGITALLIHSTVDFNLQIPSNAVLFLMLLALAWISLALPGRISLPDSY